jgi:lipid-A-disaccharide synthase
VSGPTIFISAGEPSGDLHAANLITAMRRQRPDATFFGLGGPKMAAAGCELLRDMTVHGSHMLIIEPLLEIGSYLKLIAEVDKQIQARRPDLAIFVDYPGLNFVLASRCRVARVPTFWYIPPQLWAWASFRVKKMSRRLTRVACVFPFEVDFYRRAGIDARFVGHPLMDHFAGLKFDEAAVQAGRARPGEKVVLLLPGSRRKEIEGLLPLYLNVCRLIRSRVPNTRFVMGCLNATHAGMAEGIARQQGGVEIETFIGKTNELMSVADMALAASGTATLELAHFGTPMIALYPVSRWQYTLLGRLLLRTPYLSLPNAVAGRCIVPEYYFYWGGPEPIVDDAVSLLTDEARAATMRAELSKVRRSLGEAGASERAAAAALDLIGRDIPPTPWYRWGLYV